MNTEYQPYILQNIYQEVEGTYILHLVPKSGEILSFQAGQYVFLKNPAFEQPEEAHPFSIASSPTQKKYLEFCIKIYGDWTEQIPKLKPGDTVYVSQPQGDFMWDSSISYAVFLLGGTGIAPVMSMLKYMNETHASSTVTLLYGNRTPKTIAYRDEIKKIKKTFPIQVVDIFSDISKNHPWKGYRGFITKEIIQKEVDLAKKPTFFVVGPPVFIDLTKKLLDELSVDDSHIRMEKLEQKK